MDNTKIKDEKVKAHIVLAEMERDYGLEVHRTWMESDGWLDGWQSLHTVIETKSHNLMKLCWHQGNQSFMRQVGSGGWTLVNPRDLD